MTFFIASYLIANLQRGIATTRSKVGGIIICYGKCHSRLMISRCMRTSYSKVAFHRNIRIAALITGSTTRKDISTIIAIYRNGRHIRNNYLCRINRIWQNCIHFCIHIICRTIESHIISTCIRKRFIAPFILVRAIRNRHAYRIHRIHYIFYSFRRTIVCIVACARLQFDIIQCLHIHLQYRLQSFRQYHIVDFKCIVAIRIHLNSRVRLTVDNSRHLLANQISCWIANLEGNIQQRLCRSIDNLTIGSLFSYIITILVCNSQIPKIIRIILHKQVTFQLLLEFYIDVVFASYQCNSELVACYRNWSATIQWISYIWIISILRYRKLYLITFLVFLFLISYFACRTWSTSHFNRSCYIFEFGMNNIQTRFNLICSILAASIQTFCYIYAIEINFLDSIVILRSNSRRNRSTFFYLCTIWSKANFSAFCHNTLDCSCTIVESINIVAALYNFNFILIPICSLFNRCKFVIVEINRIQCIVTCISKTKR